MTAEENAVEARTEAEPKSLSLIAVTVFYVLVGLADIAILYGANFRLTYIGILAALNLVAAVGLFLLKKWGLYLAWISALLEGFVGIVVVYATMMFSGSPSLEAYVLTGYLITIIIVALYLLKQRDKFS